MTRDRSESEKCQNVWNENGWRRSESLLRSLSQRALRQVKGHPHAIDDLITYLGAPGGEPYKNDGRPVRYARYVLVLPDEGFATIDAIERSRPFQLWPYTEETNIQARIGPDPLRSHMLGQDENEDEDEIVRALVFYTFTNTRVAPL